MAGFQSNIASGGQGIPVGSTNSRLAGGSGLEAVAKLAKSAGDIFGMVQKDRKAQGELQYKEEIAGEVLRLTELKQDLLAERKSAKEINLALNQASMERGFTASAILDVRAQLAKAEHGGSAIATALTREETKRKEDREAAEAERTAMDEIAQYHGYGDSEGIPPARLEYMADAMYEEKKRKRHLEAKQAELTYNTGNLALQQQVGELEGDMLNAHWANQTTEAIYRTLSGVDKVIAEEQKGGKTFDDQQRVQMYISALAGARQDYEQTTAMFANTIENKIAKTAFQKGQISRMQAFDGVTEPLLQYLTNEKGRKFTADSVVDLDNQAKMLYWKDPAFAMVKAAIVNNLADPNTVKEIFKIDVVGAIGKKPLPTFQLPSAPNVSPVRFLWDNPTVDPNTGEVKVDEKAVSEVAGATAETVKDVVDGKLKLPEEQKLMAQNYAISHWKDVSTNPRATNWSDGSIDLLTSGILAEGFENSDQYFKGRAKDLMPEVGRAFFGSNKDGAYVRSLQNEMTDVLSGAGFNGSFSKNIYSLTVDPNTSLIQFKLADDETLKTLLLQQKSRTSRTGLGVEVTEGEFARFKAKMNDFAHRVTHNVSTAKVLQAVAKATGQDLEAVSATMLEAIGRTGEINVDPLYMVKQTQSKTSTITDYSGITKLSREEFDEWAAMQEEETYLAKDEDGQTWIVVGEEAVAPWEG